ncbi:unnamed protein product [Adineta steineri]|uniref:Uncharacterized protein n=1 Tax=Adineta steineri TaxID=433720 RepID=A0A818RGZ3_9BILA|nr:unnamed protein product [Adineta steineri]CAF3650959.1 unnamed protein product [Adineta steineri]
MFSTSKQRSTGLFLLDSHFPDELEVLFMIGSISHLSNTNRNDEQIWTIKMTLCDDAEHDLGNYTLK